MKQIIILFLFSALSQALLAGEDPLEITETKDAISVHILGTVNRPGLIVIESTAPTIEAAIQACGGPSRLWRGRIIIHRANANGDIEYLPLHRGQSPEEMKEFLETPIQAGDILFFREPFC